MSKRPTKNIDDIFRDSIENLETAPSENFWIKTSEEALFKSNLADKKLIGKWKMAVAALALVLVSLSVYVIYMQKEISKLNGKVNVINKEVSFQGRSEKSKFTIAYQAKESNENLVEKANSSNKVEARQIQSNSRKQNGKSFASYIERKSSKKSIAFEPRLKENSTNISSHTGGNKIAPRANTNDLSEKHTVNDGINSDTSNSITLTGINTMYLPVARIAEIPAINMGENNMFLKKQPLLSKLSVSVFYEPYLSDELLENEAADNTVVNNSVVSSEEEVNPYVIGARFEYHPFSGISFITGCSFYHFKVSIQPTTIYAERLQNGDIGYAFQTSVGTVDCPYGKTTSGNALIVTGAFTTNYISVPLFVKYTFLKKPCWNLYVVAGAEMNIVAYRAMNMHWQDLYWNAGNAKEGISNAANLYYSGYISPGISFKICKGLSIYAETSLQGVPTLISKKGLAQNTSIYTGIGTGVTYQL